MSDVSRFDLVRYLNTAIVELNLPQKAIAIDLDCHTAYVSKFLNGEKPFPYRRVGDLSVDVQRAMCAAWSHDLGLLIGERARLIEAARLIVAQAEKEEAETELVLEAAREQLKGLERRAAAARPMLVTRGFGGVA